MGKQPTNLNTIIKQIAVALQGKQYAIRGTASLVLQGLDMNVDDIDIVCDRETALLCNEIFGQQLISPVSFQETKQYKSYFGKFNFDGIQVEIMGEWQIKKGDNWSEAYTGLPYGEVTIDGTTVKLTTIASELQMFAAMGRWTALQKIKRQLPPESKTKQSQITLQI
jgi:hypothetical protein